MNFTRDPIIETVITPKEGYKLIVRNSKGASSQEEYHVNALEVVSFGQSLFFRSKEKPKVFLLPVGDYEVFEQKETSISLKNASLDRSIKIGGGKDTSSKTAKEESKEESESGQPSFERSERSDRKRDRQRRRSRRGRDRDRAPTETPPSEENIQKEQEPAQQVAEPTEVTEERPMEKSPSFISKLFPPPTRLIKETIGRYKSEDPVEEDIAPLAMEENLPSEKEANSIEEQSFTEEEQ